MTDKEKIRNIIELFIAWNGETDVIDVANIDSAVEFIVGSLQEEPVSIWHDASEKPERDDLLIETNDGRIIHRQSINNYGMVKRWAYTSDLLNLDNSCNFGKNSQEEPVSEELNEAAIDYAESVDYRGFSNAPWNFVQDVFKAGAKWQRTKLMKDATDVTVHIDA